MASLEVEDVATGDLQVDVGVGGEVIGPGPFHEPAQMPVSRGGSTPLELMNR